MQWSGHCLRHLDTEIFFYENVLVERTVEHSYLQVASSLCFIKLATLLNIFYEQRQIEENDCSVRPL